jgi:bacteriorhodopsin
MNTTATAPEIAIAIVAVMAILMCIVYGTSFLLKARQIKEVPYKIAYYAFSATFAIAFCFSVRIAVTNLI